MTVNELKTSQGILIDSNLLLLYCVGRYDSFLIRKFTQRLGDYTADDYWLLSQFIEVIRHKLNRTVAITPNILTEVVNLIGVRSDQFRPVLNRLSDVLTFFEELYRPSLPLLTMPHFSKFGLTDMGLYQLAKEGYVVLTADENLRAFLVGNGYSALNFNELRVLLPQKKPGIP